MINYGEDSIRMRKTAMTHHQFSDEYLELPPSDVPEAPGLQLNFDRTNIKKKEVVPCAPESSEAVGSSRYFSFFLPNKMFTRPQQTVYVAFFLTKPSL